MGRQWGDSGATEGHSWVTGGTAEEAVRGLSAGQDGPAADCQRAGDRDLGKHQGGAIPARVCGRGDDGHSHLVGGGDTLGKSGATVGPQWGHSGVTVGPQWGDSGVTGTTLFLSFKRNLFLRLH